MRLSLKTVLTCSAVALVGGYRHPDSSTASSQAAFTWHLIRPSTCRCSTSKSSGRRSYQDHIAGSTSSSTFAEPPKCSEDPGVNGSVPGKRRKRKAVRKAIASVRKTISAVMPASMSSATVINDALQDATDSKAENLVQSMGNRVDIGTDEWFDRAVEVEYGCAAEAGATAALDALAVAKTAAADAFDAAESEIDDAEILLGELRRSLRQAKSEAASAMVGAEVAALEALSAARKATAMAAAMADKREDPPLATAKQIAVDDAMGLSYDEVEYHLSEMAPPFIDEDQCLVPGEALVRVEKAPENSRRIFAGIDIMASTEAVWNVLTDYENLHKVVPNLSVNEVLALYDGDGRSPSYSIDPLLPDEVQCEKISKQMKGAKLRQVGSAKVVGINFSAKTTLEVREWPEGMPDFAHFDEEVYDGKSRNKRAREDRKVKLVRYRFPRPFALTKLRHRDISMQSVEDDDGEFRLYQGVWRMQPLPGCAPDGGNAMRLTYAVEISPRPYLPVALVESRITSDLCNNLKCIRSSVQGEGGESKR